eukprot:TRINITY_DN5555_c0_g2_i2.p1 TRINITY_DN5555_c0_g2~~TRINITY_DN5555_c0_g2_i2.p1  ORF type:complete len:156 (+),score=37.50 TRINITY_DN5555_c0_g2_i2:703-1170(+)
MRLVNPGIFRKNYVACDIETPSKGWKATRKEKDFYSLRKVLAKGYPGCVIPLLPETALTEFGESILAERMKVFQRFLNELLSHPLLATAVILICFLSYSEEKFNTVKNEQESVPPPKAVSGCFTLTGLANIHLTKSLSELCTNLHSSRLKEHFKR